MKTYPPHLWVDKDGKWKWILETEYETEQEAQDAYIEALYMQGK